MPDSLPETSSAAPVAEGVIDNPDVKSSAAPSKAEQGSENKSMLDAVKGALNIGSEKSPGSETQDPKAEKLDVSEPLPLKDGEDDPLEGLTPIERAQLSKKTTARIRTLWQQGKDVSAKIAELEPKARQQDEFAGLMQRNRLSQSDVNNTLEIAGLINTGKPQEALEKLAPIVRKLLETAGMGNLPDDLRQEVEAGALTEQRARELAQSRASNKLASQRTEVSQQEREQEEQHRQASELRRVGVEAADAWTAEKSANDPDWNLKSDRIVELVELQVRREGWPKNREAMRKVFDDALIKANNELKKFNPRPKPRTEPATGSTSSQNAPTPKSMLEAMKLAVAKG